jgi:hypothetical protein
MANTIRPKPELRPQAEKAEHKENRYVRAFSVLAAGNSVSLGEIAKQADISERQAQGSIDVWNAAIHALDKRMALSVDPTTLIHAAGARESGFTRAVKILVQEGVDIDIAELATRASVSNATARRASELYRSVIAAQAVTQDTRNASSRALVSIG